MTENDRQVLQDILDHFKANEKMTYKCHKQDQEQGNRLDSNYHLGTNGAWWCAQSIINMNWDKFDHE